jgi:hypothetical protein
MEKKLLLSLYCQNFVKYPSCLTSNNPIVVETMAKNGWQGICKLHLMMPIN